MNATDWIITIAFLSVIAYGMWEWRRAIKANAEAEKRRMRDAQEWIRKREQEVAEAQIKHIERITSRNKAFAEAASARAKTQVKHIPVQRRVRGPVQTRNPQLPLVIEAPARRLDDDNSQVVNNLVSAAAGFALGEALGHAEETTSRRSEPVFESGGGGDFGGAGASGSWGDSSSSSSYSDSGSCSASDSSSSPE